MSTPAKVTYASLQAMIAANLDEATNGHGRPLTEYTMRVQVDPLTQVAELHCHPTGFDYKAQKYGINGNALMSEAQLDAYKDAVKITKAEEEAKARAATPPTPPPAVPVVEIPPAGGIVSPPPVLGGVK
jgi:hypothetical protein